MLLHLKSVLSILLLGLGFAVTAQKQAYLKTKDMLYYGAVHGLEKNDPTQVVFEFNNGNRRTFRPGEAIEFGIQEGQQRWVAKTFETEDYFFLQLEDGKAKLLALQEGKKVSYFLEMNDSLIAMENAPSQPGHYRDVLQTELSDCYLTDRSLKLAKYKKANLKYFVSQYNDCLHKPFPKFRIGPLVGLKLLENEIASKYFPNVPESDEALSLGFLAEVPLSYKPQLLLAFQPSVANFNFNIQETTYNPETGVTSVNTHYLKHTDLDLPLMFKYRMSFYHISPYVQAGFLAQFGLSTESYSLTDRIELRNGQYEVTEEDIYVESGALASSFFGSIVGVGVEVPISPYLTAVAGANYSTMKSDVDTGYNRKRYPEFFIGITF